MSPLRNGKAYCSIHRGWKPVADCIPFFIHNRRVVRASQPGPWRRYVCGECVRTLALASFAAQAIVDAATAERRGGLLTSADPNAS